MSASGGRAGSLQRIGRSFATLHAVTMTPAPVPALPNQRWSLDFVHDQMATGRRFRILNVVDDVTRECLAAVPDTSISGKRVVRELTDVIARRGKPGMIVSGVVDGAQRHPAPN